MKQVRKYLLAAVVLGFGLLILPPTKVFARVISLEKGVATIAKGEVINDDLFIAARTVEILGTVNGDVYAGAETVRVSGIINGDLHVGAGMVNLSGRVSEDVYIGAGSVTISGAVIGDSLLVGAGNVNIDRSSTVGGSLLAGTGTIAVNSPVKRNVLVGAGSMDLNSTVGGEARIGAGSISIGPDARIAKDLYYATDEKTGEFNISDTASVAGAIRKTETKFASEKDFEVARKSTPKILATISLVANIISLAGALIVGFLGLKLFKNHLSGAANLIKNSFWASLGTGFLICVAAVPALIILALTGVGIPLAGLTILILLFNIYLAKIVVGMAVGNWLAGRFGWQKTSIYAIFALGLAVVYLIKLIPFAGFFASLAVLWSGLGALALYYKSGLKS